MQLFQLLLLLLLQWVYLSWGAWAWCVAGPMGCPGRLCEAYSREIYHFVHVYQVILLSFIHWSITQLRILVIVVKFWSHGCLFNFVRAERVIACIIFEVDLYHFIGVLVAISRLLICYLLLWSSPRLVLCTLRCFLDQSDWRFRLTHGGVRELALLTYLPAHTNLRVESCKACSITIREHIELIWWHQT